MFLDKFPDFIVYMKIIAVNQSYDGVPKVIDLVI